MIACVQSVKYPLHWAQLASHVPASTDTQVDGRRPSGMAFAFAFASTVYAFQDWGKCTRCIAPSAER